MISGVVAREIQCPSCGAPIPIGSGQAAVAACPYCSSVVVVDAEAVRMVGKMALLAETPSCLAVGWRARCLGRVVETLGHLQLRYRGGLWDEWWVRFEDDGTTAWISQDEGEYMLEGPLDPTGLDLPAWDAVSPGDPVVLDGVRYWVEEKDEARMVGVEGELPFEVVPDERVRYLDLSDGQRKATVEWAGDDGTVEVSVGRYLGEDDLDALE